MLFGLLPQNLEFFDGFNQAAKNAHRTAELLVEMSTSEGVRRQELTGAIKENEHHGDRLTHETLDRLQKTYLTPIDREDIHALTIELDDIVDFIDAVAQRLLLYKIGTITPDFQQQCEVLVKATALVVEAVGQLRDLTGRKPKGFESQIEKTIIAIHEAENEGDDVHHRVLAALFEGEFDAFEVIKWKELYETVEQAIDCCEDLANIIHGIVLKNA